MWTYFFSKKNVSRRELSLLSASNNIRVGKSDDILLWRRVCGGMFCVSSCLIFIFLSRTYKTRKYWGYVPACLPFPFFTVAVKKSSFHHHHHHQHAPFNCTRKSNKIWCQFHNCVRNYRGSFKMMLIKKKGFERLHFVGIWTKVWLCSCSNYLYCKSVSMFNTHPLANPL